MQKPHKEEEHENDERWLLTYADLITLLMVFFVVMYALSRADTAKFAALSQSMAIAFGSPKGSVVPMPAAGISTSSGKRVPKADATGKGQRGASANATKLQNVAKAIQDMIHERGLEDMVALDGSADGRKLTIRLRDSVLFEQGGALLTPDAQNLIGRLGGVLKDIGMRVSVSGHTDDTPVRSGSYQSNWQLSTARSTAVIAFLIDHEGFPAPLLSASGYAEFHPLVPNDSPDNRSKNRRVEFVITDEGPLDLSGTPTADTTQAPAASAKLPETAELHPAA